MFKYNLGRLFRNALGNDEEDARLSRREMLGVTGLFMLTAPLMLRPSEAVAGVIKPAPVSDAVESGFTNTPFKPAEDDPEVINIGRRRRRRHAGRRRGRRLARRRRHRRWHGRRRSHGRRHYGRSHWHRRHYGPDFCLWGPMGGFCVD